uniref:Uncharacterized protein n=1 Tax=Leptobrachium leishanense TaxID=445787 RepID=A0A8C5PTX9_9ANUR
MSEFRIHHDVHEFISLLRLHGNEGAEQYIDLMQKNHTPYVTTSVSARSGKGLVTFLQEALSGFLHHHSPQERDPQGGTASRLAPPIRSLKSVLHYPNKEDRIDPGSPLQRNHCRIAASPAAILVPSRGSRLLVGPLGPHIWSHLCQQDQPDPCLPAYQGHQVQPNQCQPVSAAKASLSHTQS